MNDHALSLSPVIEEENAQDVILTGVIRVRALCDLLKDAVHYDKCRRQYDSATHRVQVFACKVSTEA
jgi:hypothetical protein